jgi:hypothetical protein
VGDASVPLLIVGDFNAYEFSDGEVDVTGMIAGTAQRNANRFWFDGNSADSDTTAYLAPEPPLVVAGLFAPAAQRYSYSYGGLAQDIDHLLLTRRAWRDFVHIDFAHGNADVAPTSGVILDPDTPTRASDHDGVVVTLAVDRIYADGYDPIP